MHIGFGFAGVAGLQLEQPGKRLEHALQLPSSLAIKPVEQAVQMLPVLPEAVLAAQLLQLVPHGKQAVPIKVL